LTVALADPCDVVAIDTLQQFTGLSVEVVSAPERDILNTIELHYGTGQSIELSIEQAMDQQDEDEPKGPRHELGEANTAEARRGCADHSSGGPDHHSGGVAPGQRHPFRAGGKDHAHSDAH